MLWFIIGAAILLALFLLVFIPFLMVFYVPTRKKLSPGEYDLPKGAPYEPYYKDMIRWTDEVRAMKYTDYSISSRDGLTLRARYYEYEKGAPVELLFHGYRGSGERDMCGAVRRCHALGRSAFIIDQRAHGTSDGHITTFGIRERYDCVDWVNFAVRTFGEDVKLMITGISMGAATVMMALGEPLPENVVCALADCGYTSSREIIRKVLSDLHLPRWFFYPIIRLGARLFGGFDLEGYSSLMGVGSSSLPIIFIHGDADTFVPSYMSEELYKASASVCKDIYIAKGADHGVAFPCDTGTYFAHLSAFEERCGAFK